MMQLFLEPVDVWLFRDGRPFDAGTDHRAVSLFPPYPTVMQGVIRSHHLVVKKVDLSKPKCELKARIEELVGTDTDYRQLRMRGPFVAKRDAQGAVTRYFPVPADTVPVGEAVESVRPGPPPNGVLTSAPTDVLLFPKGEPEKEQPGEWLAKDDLLRCLKGERVQPIRHDDLFKHEPRTGIALNQATRTTEEGALYEVEFIRPHKGVGLYVEVEGYDGWPDEGLLRIGGESRGARFAKVSQEPWPVPRDPLPRRFKLYFASPTYFRQGWEPDDWNRFFEGKVTRVAGALNRYESIGGYDLAGNKHKPARRYVPAGSVYYFESDGQARLRAGLVQNAVTDFGPEIGFGQTILEEWSDV